MKQFLLKLCPICIHSCYAKAKFWIRFHFAPKGLASEMFRGIMGYDINWESPQDLNEKINWMKFNYDTFEWSILADKYRVRKYVKERIGEKYLPKIYAVWKSAKEMDFSDMPRQFVLKTNHGCGTVLPIMDKTTCNLEKIKCMFSIWLKKKFGYDTIEPHYLKIAPPLIYAEELLANDSKESKSLVDYKVFCFNGNPYCVLVCTDRVLGKHTNLTFYDLNWNVIPDMLAGSHRAESYPIKRPDCLEELLDCASKLSKGHPQLRVDFYIVGNKIYFGEMTFTSQGGYMDYISKDYSLKMGQLVKI